MASCDTGVLVKYLKSKGKKRGEEVEKKEKKRKKKKKKRGRPLKDEACVGYSCI